MNPDQTNTMNPDQTNTMSPDQTMNSDQTNTMNPGQTNTINSDQTAPLLIWVHIVCINVDDQSNKQVREQTKFVINGGQMVKKGDAHMQ